MNFVFLLPLSTKLLKTMQLIPLHTAHLLYADAERLMTEAFPPEERRPADRQREMTDRNPNFHAHAVTLDGRFAGLLNLWMLDGFDYVEHLATLPEMRGHGLGRCILQRLTEGTERPVVLEVEPPTHELAVRRIGFYRRCGFIAWERQRYMQPPYSAHQPSIPLILMVYGNLDEEKDFYRVQREIHRKVYGVPDIFL